MSLKESAEMYLETIYILNKTSDSVRSIDVVKYTGYTKPSVSRAVNLLKNGGYIEIDDKGIITLTATGTKTAEIIYEKHCVLTDLLLKLGVDEKVARDDACKIEHVISRDTFEAIKKYVKK